MFECSAFEKERGEFLKRLYELHSVARGLSLEGHCSLLIAYFDTRPKAGIPAVYGGRCPRDEAAQEEEEAAAPDKFADLLRLRYRGTVGTMVPYLRYCRYRGTDVPTVP